MKVKLENMYKCLPIATYLPQFVINIYNACMYMHMHNTAHLYMWLAAVVQPASQLPRMTRHTVTRDETTQCYASIHSVCVGGGGGGGGTA